MKFTFLDLKEMTGVKKSFIDQLYRDEGINGSGNRRAYDLFDLFICYAHTELEHKHIRDAIRSFRFEDTIRNNFIRKMKAIITGNREDILINFEFYDIGSFKYIKLTVDIYNFLGLILSRKKEGRSLPSFRHIN